MIGSPPLTGAGPLRCGVSALCPSVRQSWDIGSGSPEPADDQLLGVQVVVVVGVRINTVLGRYGQMVYGRLAAHTHPGAT